MYTGNTLYIQEASLAEAKNTYRAINHPLRKKILEFIHSKIRIIVTDVYREFDMDQPVASQHLAILRKADIVTTEKDRRYIFYSVNYNRLGQIHEASERLVNRK